MGIHRRDSCGIASQAQALISASASLITPRRQYAWPSQYPTTALQVGLKLDADALPPGVLEKLDLKSPAATVALLKMNAVIGLQARVDQDNHITRLGVTCALCHSTVDDSVQPGIGRRLDGWPNRDLNVGGIIALSPSVSAADKAIYKSWGRGRYDPRWAVVIAGDVCYEQPMSARVEAWLRPLSASALVLIGDPRRSYFPACGVECLARYAVPTTTETSL